MEVTTSPAPDVVRPADDPGPLLLGEPRPTELAEQLLSHLWSPSPMWTALLLATGALASLGMLAIVYTVITGIGTWGNEIPAAWGFGIVNFVWWIGIGHAGTFISAFLLLLEQKWRASINRFAEAMTLFAVTCAGLFPLIHLGRAWFFYWFVPYPSTMGVWPQFRSALAWDFFAVLTYFTISLLFFYLGLIPDLAAARDRAPERWRRRIYGVFALGFRGSARDWAHHRVAYGLLAGLATPLVVSVHSIISLDFAEAQLPGWHSTIFPPFFVIGAIHSGFAMVLVLFVPARRALRFDNVVTKAHLDILGRVMLVTACLMGYCYATDAYTAWYSGDEFEIATQLLWHPFGAYGFVYWGMIGLNVLVPQLLWLRSVRRSPTALFGLGMGVLVGMWAERFLIIPGSLTHDFLPSSWRVFVPSLVDGTILFGTVGLFTFLFLLFLRVVPFIPLAEVKSLAEEESPPRRAT